MALKFVYDNIREFNGDPENITVIGHEAGAASIGLHLLSQNTPRMFNKDIFIFIKIKSFFLLLLKFIFVVLL
jgi:carboxylesterase type B